MQHNHVIKFALSGKTLFARVSLGRPQQNKMLCDAIYTVSEKKSQQYSSNIFDKSEYFFPYFGMGRPKNPLFNTSQKLAYYTAISLCIAVKISRQNAVFTLSGLKKLTIFWIITSRNLNARL